MKNKKDGDKHFFNNEGQKQQFSTVRENQMSKISNFRWEHDHIYTKPEKILQLHKLNPSKNK